MSRARKQLTGSVDLAGGTIRFNIDRLAELEEKTGEDLQGILDALRLKNLRTLRTALEIGSDGDHDADVPVLEALNAVTAALMLAVFGPDGPPESDEQEPPQEDKGTPRRAGSGATAKG